MKKRGWFLFLTLALSAPAGASLSVPEILDAHALRDGRDGKPAVDPCQDFYQFACGQWIEKTEIPADKSRIMHQSTALLDQTDEKLRDMIEGIEKQPASKRTKAAKQIQDYYKSCLAFESTKKESLSLLKSRLEEIRLLKKERLTDYLARAHAQGIQAFFAFGSGQDLRDSNSVIGYFDQSGMGLPEPSYYLDQDRKSKEIQLKYKKHITNAFKLAGESSNEAERKAQAVWQIEKALAEKAYSFDDRQNPAKINNPITREGMLKLSPGLDWSAYLKQLGAPESGLNVNEPEYFEQISKVVQHKSWSDIQAYLAWQWIRRSAPFLGDDFEKEHFSFWQKELHGQKVMKPRWKICTQAVQDRLGYALAEVYVQSLNAAAIRAKVEEMIIWIKQAFHDNLEALSDPKTGWLDQATKAEALRKLEKIQQKLGAPEKWRDYSSLTTNASTFLLNDIKVHEFENRRDLNKIGKPVDRNEWYMMPWEINAYYDQANNEFVFPFGILQPPSFDLNASDGANLGAFGGGTIGHELTHGFDNDGRQYDASGTLKDWWSKKTTDQFHAKSQCFIKQANAYKIKSVGLSVDGKKSLSENLADQGGVKLGYAALLVAQSKRRPSQDPVPLWNQKYNENQQYWIAYAQSWCGKARPEALRQQIKTNPHPPEEFRVNGVVMNRPEFARDFACKPGSRTAPKVRCEIW